jgi:hypothetical protein
LKIVVLEILAYLLKRKLHSIAQERIKNECPLKSSRKEDIAAY